MTLSTKTRTRLLVMNACMWFVSGVTLLALLGGPRGAFDRYVEASVLPLMLESARDAGIRLCLIRVLRRPVGGAPDEEPEALTRYSADMRAYVEDRGGVYFDDREDPALALLPYSDGDHVAREAREPYTRRLWEKLRAYEP